MLVTGYVIPWYFTDEGIVTEFSFLYSLSSTTLTEYVEDSSIIIE